MNQNIGNFVTEKDVKCPICGGEMKKFSQTKGKSLFKCIKCDYKL